MTTVSAVYLRDGVAKNRREQFRGNFSSRALIALPVAAVVTLSLLYLMLTMIATDYVSIDETSRIKISPVVLEPPAPVELISEKLDPPDPVEKQPDIDISDSLDTEFGDQVVVNIGDPVIEKGFEVDPLLSGNNPLIAYVRVQPEYPYSAISRGIEGFVDVQFDITASGSTRNIQVVAADPQGVFNRAATKAVAKWKYRAPIVGGEPVPVRGHRERVRFEIW